MAKLSANGSSVLLKWTNRESGTSYTLRSDRHILANCGFGWKTHGTIREGVSTQEYIEHRKASPVNLIGIVGPSLACMERWVDNGIAEALDSCRVEPDGTCPHGSPSWLLVRGLI